jgi:hypothetical protein
VSDLPATTGQSAGLVAMDSALSRWAEMREMAASLAKSGMMPKALSSPEAVLAVILTGRELGMGPMQAARSLHYVEGRVVMDASAQLALAIGAGVQVEWVTATDTEATCVLSRRGWTSTYRSTWTLAMAQRAGLAGRSTWRSHPEAMLRARAITAGIRAYCPDVLGAGVYSVDEAEDIRQTAAPAKAAPVVDVVEVVEAPAPAPPTKADTDSPAWRAWCAGLREATGQPYDVIAEWVEASGATRPSQWTASQRAGLLRALGEQAHPKRVALDAWLAARADAREPGEEG